MDRTKLHRSALAYVQHGFPVFPVMPRGKLPAVPAEEGGRGFHDATTDAAVVERWWRRWPEANIGIPTGQGSGFIVLDVDGDEGEDTLSDLVSRNGLLPETVESLTGKGRHILFQNVPGLRNSAGKLGPKLDIRGDGTGYIVVPPSIHPDTGREYAWDIDRHILRHPIAKAPEWLLEMLAQPDEGAATPAEEWRALAGGVVGEGRRNESVARLAGHLLRRYVDPWVTLELCGAWNAAHCRPPLAEHEVAATVNSIAQREMKRRAAIGRN